jgi:hypothetical protein
MQWDMKHQLINEQSNILYDLLNRLEDEFNKKFIGLKYGENFSSTICEAVLEVLEIDEIVVD